MTPRDFVLAFFIVELVTVSAGPSALLSSSCLAATSPRNTNGPTPQSLTLQGAASWRKHGASGSAGLGVPISSPAGVEPRLPGSNPQMYLEMSGPPTASGHSPSCANVVITNGTCTAVSALGNTLVVNLAGLAQNGCLTVTLVGLDNLTGNHDVTVLLRPGDVTRNGKVTSADLTRFKYIQSLGGGVFDYPEADINCDGTIDHRDFHLIAADTTSAAITCP